MRRFMRYVSWRHGAFAGVIAALLVVTAARPGAGAVLFSDDFSGTLDGWDFSATSTTWTIIGGKLDNGASGYNGSTEAALIAGITAPDVFTLSVDMVSLGGDAQPDFGHIGVVWGVPVGETAPLQNFNTVYARIHGDHVTAWSSTDGTSSTESIFAVGPLADNVVYRLQVSVDRPARVLSITLTNGGVDYTATYTGADFDRLSPHAGGRLGLVSWGDHIAYDNVVLSVPVAVPEPGSFAGLLGLLAGFGLGLTVVRSHDRS